MKPIPTCLCDLDRGVVEKIGHRLAVVCAADSLGDGWGDVDGADLGALFSKKVVSNLVTSVGAQILKKTKHAIRTNPFNLVTERDGVGADESLEDTAVKVLNGVTRENTVGNESEDGLGAVLLEDGSSLAESAASVGHVIDKDGDLVLDVTNKNLLSTQSTFSPIT